MPDDHLTEEERRLKEIAERMIAVADPFDPSYVRASWADPLWLLRSLAQTREELARKERQLAAANAETERLRAEMEEELTAAAAIILASTTSRIVAQQSQVDAEQEASRLLAAALASEGRLREAMEGHIHRSDTYFGSDMIDTDDLAAALTAGGEACRDCGGDGWYGVRNQEGTISRKCPTCKGTGVSAAKGGV